MTQETFKKKLVNNRKNSIYKIPLLATLALPQVLSLVTLLCKLN